MPTRNSARLPHRLWPVARMILGPLAVAALAGFELGGRGAATAVVGAYVVFVVAQAVVLWWGRWYLRRARLRLEARRARSAQFARRR